MKLVALSFVGATLLLAGCSAEPQATPKIATLETASSTASAPPPTSTTSQAPEEGRPRHRLDESKEEAQRINDVWANCMKDHGADLDTQPHTIEGAKKWSQDHKAAGDACRSKLPLLPWPVDPDNPEYKDNIHAWVECMKKGGMKVAEGGGEGMTWSYTSSEQPPNSAEIEEDCKRTVLGPKDK